MLQQSQCPWNVPVPTRRGSFVSLFPHHAELNLETALPAIGAYACPRLPCPSDELLYCDLQTNLASHVSRRLGSGRSGFFRNWYLKGVGRTPLAANWNEVDTLHNTGHLAASSAIREYVATEYLKALGHADTIVPCEGLLVAELNPALADFNGILYGHLPRERVPEVDRHCQAITVKPGGFARLSNLVWLLHHLTPASIGRGKTSLGVLAELLAEAFTPPGAAVPHPKDIQPATLADLHVAAVERACESFRSWFAQGLWWGSFTNNFAADGRFLDLETHAIAGGPVFGVLSPSPEETLPRKVFKSGLIGSELFAFLSQTRLFCEEAVRVLSRLAPAFAPLEMEFAAEYAREIQVRLLSDSGLLGSKEVAVHFAVQAIEESLGPFSAAMRTTVRKLLEDEHTDYFGDKPLSRNTALNGAALETDRPAPRFVGLAGLPYLRTEPGLYWRHFALAVDREILAPSNEQKQIGRLVAELTEDLDNAASASDLLRKLSLVPGHVQSIATQREGMMGTGFTGRKRTPAVVIQTQHQHANHGAGNRA
jgi:hypothetical protein